MKAVIPQPLKLEFLSDTVNENGFTEEIDEALGEEEYYINGTSIRAGSPAGVFYAKQTLAQLSEGGGSLPAVKIHDKPAFGHRGFSLDCARHFWTTDKIKQILDVMASVKMNRFHWHLTDDQGWRAEIKKYPLLTQKGAVRSSTPLRMHEGDSLRDDTPYGEGLFYTQEEMREVVAYAKERYIEVIPEVDMPGHLVAAIACYPNLSCGGTEDGAWKYFGVSDNIACCGKDDVYDFAKDVIDELTQIFPYEYFHIGGDEVPKTKWRTCPACQARIKELGLADENALQGHFNNEISKYLKERGRKMMGWHELLFARDILDTDICIQWWDGRSAHRDKVQQHIDKGGKVVVSMQWDVYMDHPYAVRPLKKTYSVSAKKLGIDGKGQILGFEAPQWVEYIRTEEKLDFNTFARLITLAEVNWSDNGRKNYKDFERRLEALRGYFKTQFGFEMPSKHIYRGKSASYLMGWYKWRRQPDYELEYAKQRKNKRGIL